ncbi:MAG: hypothetical protein Q9214_007663, partial [Letrouitia sp. 1 TL-2023]
YLFLARKPYLQPSVVTSGPPSTSSPSRARTSVLSLTVASASSAAYTKRPTRSPSSPKPKTGLERGNSCPPRNAEKSSWTKKPIQLRIWRPCS